MFKVQVQLPYICS